MATFLPVKYRFKEERLHKMNVPPGGLTARDIISCVGEPFNYYKLPSDDLMYYNSGNTQTKEDRNDIASSILGQDVYGPVLIADPNEVIGET